MRRSILSAVAIGALSVVAFAVPADARGHFRTEKLSGTSTTTSFAITASPTCDAAGNCVQGYTVTSQQSGDMQGTLTNDGTMYTAAGSSTFRVAIIGLFVGSVRGCGSGSFALTFPLTDADQSAPFTGHDAIVPGSGTGALAGITGVGTYTFDPVSGTSQGSMIVLCRAG